MWFSFTFLFFEIKKLYYKNKYVENYNFDYNELVILNK